jgi:hypothetical protein
MGAFASRSIKGAANRTKWAVFIAEEVQKFRALVSAKVLSITLLLSTHTSCVYSIPCEIIVRLTRPVRLCQD